MRLINTSTYALHQSNEQEVFTSPEYAILSHRWTGSEVTFQMLSSADWRAANLHGPAMRKIRDACTKARERKQPLKWLWVDTCCINKLDPEELASSLNSMFEWYYRATVCYAYLSDVEWSPSRRQMSKTLDEAAQKDKDRPNQESVWFERGWTLQELLAPRYMEFYDRNWNFMGTKESLADFLESVTGIAKSYLTGASDFRQASVATRMSWMAGRTTTLAEDIAYGMLGLLNINMTIYYGEGPKAFMRLQKTLMENSTDETIFAWTAPPKGLACFRKHSQTPRWSPQSWGLLAPSPDCFSKYRDLTVLPDLYVPRLSGGYRFMQQGVQFQMPMKSGTELTNFFGLPRKDVTLPLNCWRTADDGKLYNVNIQLSKDGAVYKRIGCDDLVQKKGSKPKTNSVMGVDQVITRPLTIGQPDFVIPLK
ncbi:MAG: hypothetical protein Q9216_005947 [Gyalolechia sp. 2 TL-2023]